MTTISEQLAELAELAPDVCERVKFGRYQIGGKEFGVGLDDCLYAKIGMQHISGTPALDLLQGALQRVCEARQMSIEMTQWTSNSQRHYRAYHIETKVQRVSSESQAAALLAALLEALLEAVQDD